MVEKVTKVKSRNYYCKKKLKNRFDMLQFVYQRYCIQGGDRYIPFNQYKNNTFKLTQSLSLS